MRGAFEKGASQIFIGRKKLPQSYCKPYKKILSGGIFLEKMKKMRPLIKKYKKNLDIVLAKCYNVMYCRLIGGSMPIFRQRDFFEYAVLADCIDKHYILKKEDMECQPLTSS